MQKLHTTCAKKSYDHFFLFDNFVCVFEMNISVLLHDSGVWVNKINYLGYKSDGIVISEHVISEKMILTIARELNSTKTQKN